MAVVMGIALVLVALVVREDGDTGAAPVRQESLWQSLAGIRAALATDSVGLLFLAHMTAYSSFVLIAGLWGGPYLSHVYGLGLTERGNLLLVPAITQVVGMVIWGRADRLFGSYKVPVLIGAGTTCALLWFLALAGQRPLPALVAALAMFGFFAGYTPLVVAHGKSLFPPHLVGRGMTLLNMGSMGGVFVSQTVTGWAIDLFPAEGRCLPARVLSAGVRPAGRVPACHLHRLSLGARSSVHRPERAPAQSVVLGQRPLLFVRRTDILLRCGSSLIRAIAALLGRFLPRLGPLAPASGPFFSACLLSGPGVIRKASPLCSGE